MNRLPTLVLATCVSFNIFLTGCQHSSSNASYPKSPKDVLSAFLKADSEAAGLSAESWPDLMRYTTWTKPPAWDKFVIIDHFDVGNVQTGSTRAQATVTYRTVGQMGSTFNPAPGPEEVIFHLNKVGDAWKVDSPQALPHVSWTVMQKRLADASEKDPNVKAVNDALMAQISSSAQGSK